MMKKHWISIAGVVALLCALLTFASFAEGEAVTPCDPDQHVFSAWTDVIPATCTSTGTQKRTCSVCGLEQTQISSTLTHQYGTTYEIDVEPTCTGAGSQSYHCILCGKTQPGTSVTIKATGHSFSAWEESTPATCTTDGLAIRSCSACQTKETQTIAALRHDILVEPTVDPTCTVAGHTERTSCKRCHIVFDEGSSIAALGHAYVDDEAKAPTCTEPGLTAGSHCWRCGAVQTAQKTIPKKGHTTVIDEGYPSSCTIHGKTKGSHCSVCGTVFEPQYDLSLLQHQYAESIVERTCTINGCHRFTCVNCGDSYDTEIDYAIGHQVVVEKAVEETCTTDGLSIRTYCSVCGKVIEEAHKLPALGHQWVDTVTKATRSKDGKIVTTCSVCGEVQGETVIAKVSAITISKTKYYCDGTKKTPTVIVKDADGKALTYKKDYTVTWDSGRKKVGTYYLTVTLIGNYKGTKTLRFQIILHKPAGVKVTAQKGGAKVTWSKTTGAKNYIVYYCTTKNGKYKKAGTTNKTALNVKNLKSGQTYYFIVRAAATNANGKTIKSVNSPIRKAKIL